MDEMQRRMTEKTLLNKLLMELEIPSPHIETSPTIEVFPQTLYLFLSQAQQYFRDDIGLPLRITTIPGRSADPIIEGYFKMIHRCDDFGLAEDDSLVPVQYDGLYIADRENPFMLIPCLAKQVKEIMIVKEPENILLYTSLSSE